MAPGSAKLELTIDFSIPIVVEVQKHIDLTIPLPATVTIVVDLILWLNSFSGAFRDWYTVSSDLSSSAVTGHGHDDGRTAP